MRKLLACLFSILFVLTLKGQVPNQLNYQGIARKANGHAITNEDISLRISIHDGTAAGPIVYREKRSVTTNSFGLFTVAIGSPGATNVIGSIGLVNWAVGNKYLQVEMDPDGGNNFINMGTSQLLSVPYALYAGNALPVGPAGGDLTGTYPNPTVARIRGVNVNPLAPFPNALLGFDGTNWTPTSLAVHPDNYWRFLGGNIYNANGGNVGIGLNAPTEKLQVNGNLKTMGFIMPTGAGLGKVLVSDAVGKGSWSSTFTASNILLPYKDSASSETDHIFHIIQISPTSATGALYGVTRSTGVGAFGTGGLVSSTNPGSMSVGVKGENMGTGTNGIGVYGAQNGSGWGVYGTTPSGIGVYGNSNTFYGVYGKSNTSSGVFGQSNSGAGFLAGVFGYATNAGGNGTFGYAYRSYGFGALGISDSSTGVYGQSNSPTYAATINDGVAVYALATSGGLGVYGNSFGNNAARFENTNAANATNVLQVTTNGLGRSGFFENTNASNISTTLDVVSNGTGRAVVARSNFPGFVNAGVIDGLTSTLGGNAVFGRGTRTLAWGVYGLSDSSAGVAGIGFRAGSVGVLGQGWIGTAGQFVIDNTFANTSNTVEVSNSQSGSGIIVDLTNAANTARGIDVSHAGSGIGLLSNSSLGIAGRFENTNAANSSTTLDVVSNGLGRAVVARSNFPGFVNAGVIDGLTTTLGGNAVFGRGTRTLAWGVYGLSDSSAGVAGIGFRAGSVGVLGQGWIGTAGQFVIDNTFANASNTVEVSNSQSGSGITVDLTNVANTARGIDVSHAGSGIGLLSNSNLGLAGRFENTNAANSSTTLDVVSNGTGRAVVARSNFPGFVNAGVIDGLTTTLGGNAVFGRGTRTLAWGVYGFSDSSAGVAGIGFRAGSVGLYGQSYSGTAGQFLIDNSFVNTSNAVEVSNSQSGSGITVDLTNVANTARGIDVSHAGSGIGLLSNSSLGIAGKFENTNVSNSSTTLDVVSNGTGRAIVARSNFPGFVNAGVIDGLTTTLGGNAVFGRGTRTLGWGVYGLSDSSAGVAGIGFRAGSVGVFGQSYSGTAAQFLIDNSFVNTSNAVEVTNSQTGKGIMVNITNSGNSSNGVEINHAGVGTGIYSNSSLGIAGRFENINAANANDMILSTTNGLGRAVEGFINNTSNNVSVMRGETNGTGNGVTGVGTNNNTTASGVYGFHSGTLGNGVIGWGTKALTYGVIGHADSAVGVYGESGLGNAAYFLSYGANGNVPALYTQSNGLSNVASFFAGNASNSADAVTINRVGAGRSLMVSMASFANPMNFYDVVNTGKQTARIEGNAGLGLLAHAGGTFTHSVSSERVGVGVYGQADSVGSQYNYGLVGNAKGGSLENAGVIGWIASGAAGSVRNAAIYGVAFAGPAPRYAGLFEGDVQVTGTLSKGGGSFKIDHPQDPANKYLVHSFVESPDMMNVYNGNVVTDAEGKAVVDLPGYFEAENKDFKYQLTVIGQFAQAIIGEEIKSNQFIILTDKPNVKVSWQVTGVRDDRFAQQNRIIPEVEKKGNEKGKYLYPELYGQSREQGITFMKSAMPLFQGEGKGNSSRAQLAENSAQERVNDGVEQKRRLLNTQPEQSTIQIAKVSTSKPADKSMKMPVEKTSNLSASLSTPEQAKTVVTEEKKEMQVPTEKIKQMVSAMGVTQEEAQLKKETKANEPLPTAEKMKQLSSTPELSKPSSAKAAAAEVKTKAPNPSSEKMKQLSTSTPPSEEQGSKKVEKPKSASSSADQKKLTSPQVKLPVDQQKATGKKD